MSVPESTTTLAALFSGPPLTRSRVTPLGRARQLLGSFRVQLKMLAVDAFNGFLQVIWPLFFATAAFLMFRQNGDPRTMVYAALGSAVMGTWSAIAMPASNALQRERSQGTLELLVTTPTPFAFALAPIITAMTSLGAYSLAATLLWGRYLFGVELSVRHPVAFAVSLVATVFAVSMFGFLLAVSVVRYRSAWALGNLFEYPGWLLCGFLVPLALLPDWAGWIGRALPPTWGMAAVRSSSSGGDPWRDILVCLALGLVYAAVASMLAERVLRSARQHATLALS